MDLHDAIKARKSVRKYQSTPIPEEVLNKVLDAMRVAPSGCNYQPWRFIVVKDQATKDALVPACKGQSFISQASAIVVGCGFEEKSYQHMGGWGTSMVVDVAVALDHLTLAAAAEGLGTCWIGAFKEEGVRQVLGIPSAVRVVALIPVGYPDETPTARPRRALTDVVCYDKWKE